MSSPNPNVIVLVGPDHPTATALRRQHEQLVEALFQTRKHLRAYGVTPGNLVLEGESMRQTPMTPPESEDVLWSKAGPHQTHVKAKARYEARKEVLANRPSRERILAAITRALSGSATTLNSRAIHRFVLAELGTTEAEISMQTVSKYLGKNQDLFCGRASGGSSPLVHWYLNPKSSPVAASRYEASQP